MPRLQSGFRVLDSSVRWTLIASTGTPTGGLASQVATAAAMARMGGGGGADATDVERWVDPVALDAMLDILTQYTAALSRVQVGGCACAGIGAWVTGTCRRAPHERASAAALPRCHVLSRHAPHPRPRHVVPMTLQTPATVHIQLLQDVLKQDARDIGLLEQEGGTELA